MAGPRYTDIYLCAAWIFTTISVGTSETCSYITYGYNALDNRNEQMVSFKECGWGCCWKFTDPCCSAPTGLIAGSVLGALICLVMLILLACCCCISARRSAPRGGVIRRPGEHAGSWAEPGVNVISSPHSTPHTSDVHMGYLNTGMTSHPSGGVFDPPPSYEEVMSGHHNCAFKTEEDSR